MSYSDFEIRLLIALVDSADASERGQCEAFDVAETVLPQVNDQWVSDAVRSYEQRGYIGLISRPLERRLVFLTISSESRKAAESLKAQIAVAQQPRPKIGFV
jgi:DNA-binding MarR family transcriptional regulator